MAKRAVILHDDFLPGAQAADRQVFFKVGVCRSFAAVSCHLVIWADGGDKRRVSCDFSGLELGRDLFIAAFRADAPALYWYSFEAVDMAGQTLATDVYQLTVYDASFTTPDWLKGGICYQIFPDRFYRGGTAQCRPLKPWDAEPDFLPDAAGVVRNDDFFGGDLAGIIAKMDYLASLGVSCLYLNPVFAAASNHRYDTADYFQIDPLLGSNDDFKRLCAEAQKRGIKIILDGVFSHSGADSVYFNKYGNYQSVGAYQSKDSPYYPWYKFNNWPDDYACWWGVAGLPELNEDEESYRDFICGEQGVLRYWLKLGAAGFRLDVADELTDGFLQALRQTVKQQDAQALIVGEVWEDASNKISYGQRRRYLLGDQLDGVTNYPLYRAVVDYLRLGDAAVLANTMRQLCANYPPPALNCLMNVMGTHDTARLITALAGQKMDGASKSELAAATLSDEERRRGVKLVKMAALLQMTLPGFPCIYYGDEAGLAGYGDPFCRRTYPWGRQDQELLDWYRLLGGLRRRHQVLAEGKYRLLKAQGGFFAFSRGEAAGERLLVAVNRGKEPWRIRTQGVAFDLIKGEYLAGTTLLTENNYMLLRITDPEVK